MQVRMLIGRMAGEIVEMAYDRAVANRDLGHVQFVGPERVVERVVIDTPGNVGLYVTPMHKLDVGPAPRPRGRPRTRGK